MQILQTNARNPNTPEHTNQIHKRRFLRADLFVQIQQGRNYETRRCSGYPKWCRMLALGPFRGVPEKRLIPMPATQKLRVPSDHQQRESDGVTRQRQRTRTCSCAGKQRPSARQRVFHATGKPRAECSSPCVRKTRAERVWPPATHQCGFETTPTALRP